MWQIRGQESDLIIRSLERGEADQVSCFTASTIWGKKSSNWSLGSEDSQVTALTNEKIALVMLTNKNQAFRILTNDKRVVRILPGPDHGVREDGKQELEDVNDIRSGPGLYQPVQ